MNKIMRALIMATAVLGICRISHAATWLVLSSADGGGTDTLRYAIWNAKNGDVINFNFSNTNIQLNDTYGALTVSASVVINGNSNVVLGNAGLSYNVFNILTSNCQILNLAVGHGAFGIFINGVNNTVIKNCRIGLDYSNASISNVTGIGMSNDSGTIIGGSTAGSEGNVIGNNTTGYGIRGYGSSYFTIQGNYIGTNATGASMPNVQGIHLENNCTQGTIGGLITTYENVISDNTNYNIYMQNSGQTLIEGNIIGLDSNQNLAYSQGAGIYLLNCTAVQIGDPGTGGLYNVIGGNTTGIFLYSSSGNWIYQNFIGLNSSGSARANTDGIHLTLSDNNIIGDQRPGSRIAGNTQYGLWLESGNNNAIRGNYFGHNANGSVVLNGSYAMVVSGAGNTIGGSNALSYGNFICGPAWVNNASQISVFGNYFGTLPGGAQIDNHAGLQLANSNACQIGDGTAANQNLICGGNIGITIDSSPNNTIDNNWIGALSNGTAPASPVQTGIKVSNGSQSNRIQHCLISHTTSSGINVDGASTIYNVFSANTICAFANAGISLTSSSNESITPPVIDTAISITGITGHNGANGGRVELFVSDQCSTAGGSVTYLGFCTANTSGSWTFPVTLAPGTVVTAIATNTNHDSSGFAANFTVTGPILTPTFTVTVTPTITPTINPALATRTPTPTATVTSTPRSTSPNLNGKTVLAYPNPGKDKIQFAVNLGHRADITIRIYNLRGEKTAELKAYLDQGSGVLAWDCSQIGPGIYVAQVLENGGKQVAMVKVAISR